LVISTFKERYSVTKKEATMASFYFSVDEIRD